MSGLVLASLSGTLASLASVFSKLTFDSSENLLESFVLRQICPDAQNKTCYVVFGGLRVIFLCAMISCNALMLTTFTKGMQMCRSTAEAVVVNNATNFILTAVIGSLLFGEALAAMWWCGAGLVVIGLAVMWDTRSSQSKDPSHQVKED